MPIYKYQIETARKLTEPEKAELRDGVARAWAGMQRRDERHAQLATTMHNRHLKRVDELWTTHPAGHTHAGEYVLDAEARAAHLLCADCSRTLIGYGTAGGLLCPELAGHPGLDGIACHPACIVECGEVRGSSPLAPLKDA